MIKLIDAQFVVTAVEPKGYPTGHSAEVAFVGRSNVGKSSMINALTGRKKLLGQFLIAVGVPPDDP